MVMAMQLEETADVLDDRAAFCTLHMATLSTTLGLFVRDALVGEELAQEVLLRACERWDDVRALASPRAWLYRVGTNLARSRARRIAAGARALARHGPRPEAQEPDTAEALDVRRALTLLPGTQRDVAVLRHLVGLSVAETAEALGLSEGAVRTRDHRARSSMRQHLVGGE